MLPLLRERHPAQHGPRSLLLPAAPRCCTSATALDPPYQEGCSHCCALACRPQVLVDERDWEHDATQPPVAYVAQELLGAPELDDSQGRCWLEVHGEDDLEHPYASVLFLGQVGEGAGAWWCTPAGS
jgi:hypothetical protein